jgi:hypothetical protein
MSAVLCRGGGGGASPLGSEKARMLLIAARRRPSPRLAALSLGRCLSVVARSTHAAQVAPHVCTSLGVVDDVVDLCTRPCASQLRPNVGLIVVRKTCNTAHTHTHRFFSQHPVVQRLVAPGPAPGPAATGPRHGADGTRGTPVTLCAPYREGQELPITPLTPRRGESVRGPGSLCEGTLPKRSPGCQMHPSPRKIPPGNIAACQPEPHERVRS